MKHYLSPLFIICISTLLHACSHTKSGPLLDSNATVKWQISGNVSLKDGVLTLSGENASAVLENGKYRNFLLSMEVCSSTEGKGELWFHTNRQKDKGYAVAINNNREDEMWWKMSGSLLAVRNLTKSFVKENDWFDLHIKVEGRTITVNINGEPVVEYTEPLEPYRTDEHKNMKLSSGTFAITGKGKGEIAFRNMRVSVLDAPKDDTGQLADAIDEQNDDIIRLHQEDFPVLDYHVHLKGGLTKEVAARQSRKLGINYTIAPNCGIGFPITSDEEIYAYLDTMRTQPFILAMQAEGREWLSTFSEAARDEFDFVFTDALTFTDDKGHRTRLWIAEETWIEDEQVYMDMIVDRICEVLKEPVDVYVNPCFLPESMSDRYDEFWTEERMNRFIDALAASGKAMEINELYNIPNKAIIMKAKEAGVKFTFGTNNVVPQVSMLEYSIRMKTACGLTAADMYKPKIKI